MADEHNHSSPSPKLTGEEFANRAYPPNSRHTRAEVDLYEAYGGAFKELLQLQRLLYEHQQSTHAHVCGEFKELKTELQTYIKETIMAAIDDLKKNIGDLIAEGTADITALVQRAAQQGQSQGGASEQDLQKLADDVAEATRTMHSAFMQATGTSVPSTSSSGASSNATDTSSSGSSSTSGSTSGSDASAPATSPSSGDQSGVSSSPSETSSDQSSSSGATTVGPESFKSGA